MIQYWENAKKNQYIANMAFSIFNPNIPGMGGGA